MSLYIITLDEAKAELAINDQKDDVLLTQAIENLQGRFVDHCGREFERKAETEYFDGGVSELMLRRFPVESISEVNVDPGRAFAADTVWAATTDYFADQRRGVLVRANAAAWPYYPQGIMVSYAGGYISAGQIAEAGQLSMPHGLRGAFLMQFAFEWRNRLNLGKESMGAQGMSVSLAPAELLPAVRQTLQFYMRHV